MRAAGHTVAWLVLVVFLGTPPAGAAAIAGLPLHEVPATAPATDLMAVMLSGDGGWAALDRGIASTLARNGVAVVGWDSLRYFWTARTPHSAAGDLARILRQYLHDWSRSRVIAIGYSAGADTLPFMVNRLPPELRDRVVLIALLAPTGKASFEFHVSQWFSDAAPGLPLAPELDRLADTGMLCMYGDAEPEPACAALPDGRYVKVRFPGGHHFDRDYAALARRILQAVPRPAR